MVFQELSRKWSMTSYTLVVYSNTKRHRWICCSPPLQNPAKKSKLQTFLGWLVFFIDTVNQAEGFGHLSNCNCKNRFPEEMSIAKWRSSGERGKRQQLVPMWHKFLCYCPQVVWKKCVHLHSKLREMPTVERWDKAERKHVRITCPNKAC